MTQNNDDKLSGEVISVSGNQPDRDAVGPGVGENGPAVRPGMRRRQGLAGRRAGGALQRTGLKPAAGASAALTDVASVSPVMPSGVPVADMKPGQGGQQGPGVKPGQGGQQGPGMKPGQGGQQGPGMKPGQGGQQGPGMKPGQGGQQGPGMKPGQDGQQGPGVKPGQGGQQGPGMKPGLGGQQGPGMKPGQGSHAVVVAPSAMGAEQAEEVEISRGAPAVEAVGATGWRRYLGSVALLSALLAVLVLYFGFVASPRYAVESQFLVKESGRQAELSGLASLGAVTSSTRDALVIKAFIESRSMADELDRRLQLRQHFESPDIDWFSRLSSDATAEEFLKYYQSRITVGYDETSDIIKVELQAFDAGFAYHASQVLIDISEEFINALGDKMAQEQVAYAEDEVQRAHSVFKDWQKKVLGFQEVNNLFNPESEGGAILDGVNALQVELIKADARLKELSAVMRDDSAEVKAQKNLILSLRRQLEEERSRLTQDSAGGFNKINVDYKELTMGAELAGDLYKSSLVGLDQVRSEAMQKLKHLLIIEPPLLPEEALYPKRIYNIVNWFVVILLIYFIGRLVVAVINEHKD